MNNFTFDKMDSTQKYILIAAVVLGLILILPYAGIHIFSAPASSSLPIPVSTTVKTPVKQAPYTRRVQEQPARSNPPVSSDRKLSDIEDLLR